MHTFIVSSHLLQSVYNIFFNVTETVILKYWLILPFSISYKLHWGWLERGGCPWRAVTCADVLFRDVCLKPSTFMHERGQSWVKDFRLRLLLYDLEVTAHYLILQWYANFLFISEKLQSVITFEVNGWLSLFFLRGLFFAKLKFELLEQSDQLKDHEAT